ncbi:hypothetical protein [Brunnivagina elsteri]|nr:hypothetical protein [Calothrix elsteri]
MTTQTAMREAELNVEDVLQLGNFKIGRLLIGWKDGGCIIDSNRTYLL